jgi:hypothetical protein
MTIEEQNKLLLSKRSNNHLDTSKLEGKYEISSIKDNIRKCLSNL